MSDELIPISRELIDRLTAWRICMSYNDSYFGEPAGELKRITHEMERAVNRIDYPENGNNELRILIDRFLAWPLPQTVCSDSCVTDSSYAFPRSGTNLLNAEEAKQMIRYLLKVQKHTYLQSKWKTGIPPTKEGHYNEYIVAVRRAHKPEKVFVFSAEYANKYDDELYDQDGKPFIADGWYNVGEDSSGEFSNLFTPMLQQGDEVVAWQELPRYNP